MSVNNGKRTQVSMLGYDGLAGLVELEDRDVISFPLQQGALQVSVGSEVTVAGAARRVLSIAASPFLRDFKVLELAK